MELGLLCWKRRRRTPHDGCIWLAKGSPGDRGSAGTRARPSGTVTRARIGRSNKGVLARPPESEQGNPALPGNGQVSLQKSFGGVLVQRSVVTATQQSRCHGVTGDLAREPKQRGDTLQGLAESGRFFEVSTLARG